MGLRGCRVSWGWRGCTRCVGRCRWRWGGGCRCRGGGGALLGLGGWVAEGAAERWGPMRAVVMGRSTVKLLLEAVGGTKPRSTRSAAGQEPETTVQELESTRPEATQPDVTQPETVPAAANALLTRAQRLA